MDRWIWNDVATNLPLEVFTQRNFVADFFREKLNLTGTNSDIAFLCHPLGNLVITYALKSAVDFLLMPIELFSPALTVEALWADIGRNHCVRKGVGHFERKFQGELGSPTNDCWRQKTRVSGLSRGVVCVILRLAVLILYRRVTDRQTHDDG